jgi:hypothetical protein
VDFWKAQIDSKSLSSGPKLQYLGINGLTRANKGFGKMFGIRKIIQVLQSERPKSNTNVAIFGITKLEYRMLGTYRL